MCIDHSIKAFSTNLRLLLKKFNEQAIVVYGSHGSGKSHLVQKIVSQNSKRSSYVSLIGKSSESEIKSEIHSQIVKHKGWLKRLIYLSPLETILIVIIFCLFKDNFVSIKAFLVANIALGWKLIDRFKPYAEKKYKNRIENLSFIKNYDTLIFDDFYKTPINIESFINMINKLKSARRCKIIIILNDNLLPYEKQLAFMNNCGDSFLRLEPSAEECFDFVFNEKTCQILKQECCKSKITHLQILKKIKHTFSEIQKILCTFTTETQTIVIKALVFFQTVESTDLNDAMTINAETLSSCSLYFKCPYHTTLEEVEKAKEKYGEEKLKRLCEIRSYLDSGYYNESTPYLDLTSTNLNQIIANLVLKNSISEKDKFFFKEALSILQKNIDISNEFKKIEIKRYNCLKNEQDKWIKMFDKFTDEYGISALKNYRFDVYICSIREAQQQAKANELITRRISNEKNFKCLDEADYALSDEVFKKALIQAEINNAVSEIRQLNIAKKLSNLSKSTSINLDPAEKIKSNRKFFTKLWIVLALYSEKEIVLLIEQLSKNLISMPTVFKFFSEIITNVSLLRIPKALVEEICSTMQYDASEVHNWTDKKHAAECGINFWNMYRHCLIPNATNEKEKVTYYCTALKILSAINSIKNQPNTLTSRLKEAAVGTCFEEIFC